MRMHRAREWWWMPAATLWLLSGCDQLGLETPAKTAERQIAEAKAIGGACRHALRAIEDCYILNAKADKSSVFAGWREMDEYMRENKLEGIAPVVPRPPSAASKARAKSAEDDEPEDEVVVSETTARSASPSEPETGGGKNGSGDATEGSTARQKAASSEGASKSRSSGASGAEKPASGARP